MKGNIFNIQRFSIYDGPGVRTTVFFKGCNLRCIWCHNPESISFKREVELFNERCIHCGSCFDVCPQKAHYTDYQGTHRIDREICEGCMECADNCFAEALVAAGKEISVDDLMNSILTDKPYFIESNGGVTFSGGECMLQADFLRELLLECKKNGIHTAIDTAGNVQWSSFEKVLDYTDLFLYDLKAYDCEVHKMLTEVGNTLILENLYKLIRAGARVHVRLPLIPGFNDGQLAGIASVLKGLSVEKVELMPYHRLGEGKYDSLGLECKTKNIRIPSDEEISKALELLKENEINAVKA